MAGNRESRAQVVLVVAALGWSCAAEVEPAEADAPLLTSGGSPSAGDSPPTVSGVELPTPRPEPVVASGGSPSTNASEPLLERGPETLRLSPSSYTWTHASYQEDAQGFLQDYDLSQHVTTSWTTQVIESDYLRVTLLPDFGGRILSIVYKPTNQELLYQNPVGTPYEVGKKAFYYDYLMILGGIFPTFPESEHGKYWNRPFSWQVVEESAEKITVRMSRTDDLDVVPGVPGQFSVGRTDLRLEMDVTVYAERSIVEVDYRLHNPRPHAVSYEYWTCTTLAPGSAPGASAATLDAFMMVPIDVVHVRNDVWAWLGSVETPVNADLGLFEWNHLAYLRNWQDMGIAYASPSMQGRRYWGVIDRGRQMGVVRVADNDVTPGLKYWTFGRDSVNVDPQDTGSGEFRRPMIELWAGHSNEFFQRAEIQAGATRSWRETYLPTIGLPDGQIANEDGVVWVERNDDGFAEVTLWLTHPYDQVVARIFSGEELVVEQDHQVDPSQALHISTEPGEPSSELRLEVVKDGELILGGQL